MSGVQDEHADRNQNDSRGVLVVWGWANGRRLRAWGVAAARAGVPLLVTRSRTRPDSPERPLLRRARNLGRQRGCRQSGHARKM